MKVGTNVAGGAYSVALATAADDLVGIGEASATERTFGQ